MEFKVGDKIKYYFPNPKNSLKPNFIGIIEAMSENHILIKNAEDVILKVSFGNFDLLRPVDSLSEDPAQISENYVG